MNHNALMGEAVHALPAYLGRNPEADGPLEAHLNHLWNMPGFDRSHFSKEEQVRIQECWGYMWGLAQEANNFWAEEPGEEGKDVDLVRRMKAEYEAIEFKIADVHAMNQKSRKQIRGTMARLRKILGKDTVIRGYRVFLNCDLATPFSFDWKEVTCD